MITCCPNCRTYMVIASGHEPTCPYRGLAIDTIKDIMASIEYRRCVVALLDAFKVGHFKAQSIRADFLQCQSILWLANVRDERMHDTTLTALAGMAMTNKMSAPEILHLVEQHLQKKGAMVQGEGWTQNEVKGVGTTYTRWFISPRSGQLLVELAPGVNEEYLNEKTCIRYYNCVSTQELKELL